MHSFCLFDHDCVKKKLNNFDLAKETPMECKVNYIVIVLESKKCQSFFQFFK